MVVGALCCLWVDSREAICDFFAFNASNLARFALGIYTGVTDSSSSDDSSADLKRLNMFELITIVFWFYTKRKEQKIPRKKCTASKTEQNGSNK